MIENDEGYYPEIESLANSGARPRLAPLPYYGQGSPTIGELSESVLTRQERIEQLSSEEEEELSPEEEQKRAEEIERLKEEDRKQLEEQNADAIERIEQLEKMSPLERSIRDSAEIGMAAYQGFQEKGRTALLKGLATFATGVGNVVTSGAETLGKVVGVPISYISPEASFEFREGLSKMADGMEKIHSDVRLDYFDYLRTESGRAGNIAAGIGMVGTEAGILAARLYMIKAATGHLYGLSNAKRLKETAKIARVLEKARTIPGMPSGAADIMARVGGNLGKMKRASAWAEKVLGGGSSYLAQQRLSGAVKMGFASGLLQRYEGDEFDLGAFAKQVGWGTAFMATTVPAGYIGNPILRKGADFLMNTGLSMMRNEYAEAVKGGEEEALAMGLDEDSARIYGKQKGLMVHAINLMFSLGTGSYKQEIARASRIHAETAPRVKAAFDMAKKAENLREQSSENIRTGIERMLEAKIRSVKQTDANDSDPRIARLNASIQEIRTMTAEEVAVEGLIKLRDESGIDLTSMNEKNMADFEQSIDVAERASRQVQAQRAFAEKSLNRLEGLEKQPVEKKIKTVLSVSGDPEVSERTRTARDGALSALRDKVVGEITQRAEEAQGQEKANLKRLASGAKKAGMPKLLERARKLFPEDKDFSAFVEPIVRPVIEATRNAVQEVRKEAQSRTVYSQEDINDLHAFAGILREGMVEAEKAFAEQVKVHDKARDAEKRVRSDTEAERNRAKEEYDAVQEREAKEMAVRHQAEARPEVGAEVRGQGAAKEAEAVGGPVAERLAPLQERLAAVPPKADGSVDMEARQRVVDEWKAQNPEAVREIVGEITAEFETLVDAASFLRPIDTPDLPVTPEVIQRRLVTGADDPSRARIARQWFADIDRYAGDERSLIDAFVNQMGERIAPTFDRDYETWFFRNESAIKDPSHPRHEEVHNIMVVLHGARDKLQSNAATRRAMRYDSTPSPLTLRPDGTLAGMEAARPAEAQPEARAQGIVPGRSVSSNQPVTREAATSQIEALAAKTGGEWTPLRAEGSPDLGTLRIGNATIRYTYEPVGEGYAATVERKQGFDYTVRVDPETGRLSSVAHEAGHITRDVLSADERALIKRATGIDLESREGDEAFARTFESRESLRELADKVRALPTQDRGIVVGAINKVIDFVNGLLGTNISRIGEAGDIAKLADNLEEFGILREMAQGERGMDTRGEAGEREMMAGREVPPHLIESSIENMDGKPMPLAEGEARPQEPETAREMAEGETVVRMDEPGTQPDPNKPQGLYLNREGQATGVEPEMTQESRYTWKAQNPLDVSSDTRTVEHARGGGMKVPPSAGIKALRQMVSEQEFDRLMSMSKRDAIAEASAKYPDVEWGRFYDAYEVLEGYAGMLARDRGYDAIVSADERVALSDKAIQPAARPAEATPEARAQETTPRPVNAFGARLTERMYRVLDRLIGRASEGIYKPSDETYKRAYEMMKEGRFEAEGLSKPMRDSFAELARSPEEAATRFPEFMREVERRQAEEYEAVITEKAKVRIGGTNKYVSDSVKTLGKLIEDVDTGAARFADENTKAIFKGMSDDEDKYLMRYFWGRQFGDIEAGDFGRLPDNIKDRARQIDKLLSEVLSIVNEARQAQGEAPLPELPNYFPLLHKGQFAAAQKVYSRPSTLREMMTMYNSPESIRDRTQGVRELGSYRNSAKAQLHHYLRTMMGYAMLRRDVEGDGTRAVQIATTIKNVARKSYSSEIILARDAWYQAQAEGRTEPKNELETAGKEFEETMRGLSEQLAERGMVEGLDEVPNPEENHRHNMIRKAMVDKNIRYPKVIETLIVNPFALMSATDGKGLYSTEELGGNESLWIKGAIEGPNRYLELVETYIKDFKDTLSIAGESGKQAWRIRDAQLTRIDYWQQRNVDQYGDLTDQQVADAINAVPIPKVSIANRLPMNIAGDVTAKDVSMHRAMLEKAQAFFEEHRGDLAKMYSIRKEAFKDSYFRDHGDRQSFLSKLETVVKRVALAESQADNIHSALRLADFYRHAHVGEERGRNILADMWQQIGIVNWARGMHGLDKSLFGKNLNEIQEEAKADELGRFDFIGRGLRNILGGDRIERAVYGANHFLPTLFLAGNIRWALTKQWTSIGLVPSVTGITNLVHGFARHIQAVAEDKLVGKIAGEDVPIGEERYRGSTAAAVKRNRTMMQSYSETQHQSIRASARRVIGSFAQIFSGWTEDLLAGGTYEAAHLKGKQVGMSGERLNYFKTRTVGTTQSFYHREARQILLNSQLFRFLQPFQSFAFDAFTTMIWEPSRSGSFKGYERYAYLSRGILAVTLVNYITMALYGKKAFEGADPTGKAEPWKFWYAYGSFIPGYGGGRGPRESGVIVPPIIGATVSPLWRGMKEYLETGDPRLLARNGTPLLIAGMGLPWAQMFPQVVDTTQAIIYDGIAQDRYGNRYRALNTDNPFSYYADIIESLAYGPERKPSTVAIKRKEEEREPTMRMR